MLLFVDCSPLPPSPPLDILGFCWVLSLIAFNEDWLQEFGLGAHEGGGGGGGVGGWVLYIM